MAIKPTNSSSSKESCRVIIVGGGLAGLATSIGLRKAGLQVLVLEQAAELQEIGAGIEIPPNSSRILERWGLLETIKREALCVPNIVHQSYRDGSLLSVTNLEPHCECAYGALHLCVHRVDFHTCLREEAKRLGVAVKLDCKIVNVDTTKPAVVLRSGEVYEANLVLGSDGERSICRGVVVGHPEPPRHSGDLVYRILLKQEVIRQSPDLRGLLDPAEFHIWSGPGGHAISYALKRDDEYNIAFTQPDPSPEKVVFGERDADLNEVRTLFKAWDPKIKALLDVSTKTSKWPLLESSDLSTWVHPAGKVGLIGDAAHAMFPCLGQGAAQAVEDAAVLSTFFDEMTDISQIPDILSMYEQLRKPRAMKIKHRSRKMLVTHSYPDGPLQEERDRQLTQNEPFEGYPAAWGDPVLQEYMWGYDALEDAAKVWSNHLGGEKKVNGNV